MRARISPKEEIVICRRFLRLLKWVARGGVVHSLEELKAVVATGKP